MESAETLPAGTCNMLAWQPQSLSWISEKSIIQRSCRREHERDDTVWGVGRVISMVKKCFRQMFEFETSLVFPILFCYGLSDWPLCNITYKNALDSCHSWNFRYNSSENHHVKELF